VLIGGAAVSEEFAQEIGADAYCVDGFAAVKALEAFETAKP
jgi:methanogenic corrinoid protein MtbC1